MCQEARRNSPSVADWRPTSSCIPTTSRIAPSSAARSSSAVARPAAKSSRALRSSGGRSRLPTWSARKGGVVRGKGDSFGELSAFSFQRSAYCCLSPCLGPPFRPGQVAKTRSCSGPQLPALQHPAGDGEGGVGGGDAAVDGAVQEHLFYLVFRQAVAEGALEVRGELFVVAAGHEGRKGYGAAGLAVEGGAGPDLTPRVARDEVLEIGGEGSRLLQRRVHVRVAEDLAADLHAVVVGLVPGHSASRWLRMSRVKIGRAGQQGCRDR